MTKVRKNIPVTGRNLEQNQKKGGKAARERKEGGGGGGGRGGEGKIERTVSRNSSGIG